MTQVPPPARSLPPQQTVDDLLRKKRKAREHKACYPCRQRKVKCDLSRPCQTCRDRQHPELCSYHPPEKRQRVDDDGIRDEDEVEGVSRSSSVYQAPIGRAEFESLCRKLDGLEDMIGELRKDLRREANHSTPSYDRRPTLSTDRVQRPSSVSSMSDVPQTHSLPRHTDVHGIHTKNDAGEIVHFGGGSIPALLYSISQGLGRQAPTSNNDNDHQLRLQEALGKSILPLFGLDNESTTYPFVDLWGLPHASRQRAEQLVTALPDDDQLIKLWTVYRELGYTIYPGITDLDEFEERLRMFMRTRAAQAGSSEGVTDQKIYGRDYYWLGLLFAVLGSGAQCSTLPRKQRELTSQVYVCCGFECLRFTNFLSQPHIESIQTLLIIGNVMTNNMNAGTAWSLLGLTIRLAQGLGLHRSCPPNVPRHVILPRSKVWWAVIWQDSLLSITYDRASSVAAPDINTMSMPQHYSSDVSPYHRTMYRLCQAALDIVRDRARVMDSQEHISRITKHSETVSLIMAESAEYLRDIRQCHTATEAIQHRGLFLHSSYILSELYRPAISHSTLDNEHVTRRHFRQACIDNLSNTVEAYLHLNEITAFARNSWAAMHRALSSALLLGILGEHLRDERARKLIGGFIAVMRDITDTISPQEVAAPVQRGIAALRKLQIVEFRPVSRHEGAALPPITSLDFGGRFGGNLNGTGINGNEISGGIINGNGINGSGINGGGVGSSNTENVSTASTLSASGMTPGPTSSMTLGMTPGVSSGTPLGMHAGVNLDRSLGAGSGILSGMASGMASRLMTPETSRGGAENEDGSPYAVLNQILWGEENGLTPDGPMM